MIVSVILCGLMSIVILFFVIANNGFSAVSIFYGLFLMFIYGGMTFSENKKKGSGTIYRRIFLTTYAVFFCIGFIANLFAERGSMAITNEALATCELPFCHIVIPQGLLSYLATQTVIFPARVSGHFASIASMLAIWLVFTLVLGRGWCAWVCFYGGWDEGFSHIAKKRRLNLLAHNKEIREFQFGFLFFLVLACFGTMSALYCDWFCPYKIVTEFSPMTTIPGLIAGIIFIGLFLGLVVVLPILTKRRTQCSMLCPFGAFASLTDKLSPFKMRIDTEKCKGCMKCAQACLFGAIDVATIQQKKNSPEITCAKCGECIAACPEKAISYQFRFNKGCCAPVPKTKLGKGIQKFFAPENLFRFAAFTFGAIMSSAFTINSIEVILKFFAH